MFATTYEGRQTHGRHQQPAVLTQPLTVTESSSNVLFSNRHSTKGRSSSRGCVRRAGEVSNRSGDVLWRPHTLCPVGPLRSDAPQWGWAIPRGEYHWPLHPRDLCSEGGWCRSVHPQTVQRARLRLCNRQHSHSVHVKRKTKSIHVPRFPHPEPLYLVTQHQ